MGGRKEKFYSIGDMSEMCNTPIKTLRYYDSIGLLPSYRNQDNNYRYYVEDQMLTLFIIKKLRQFGFSLDDIKKLVYSSDVALLEKSITDKLKDLNTQIEDLRKQYVEGSFLLERISTGKRFLNYTSETDSPEKLSKNYENAGVVTVEDIPVVDCVFTRKIEKNYQNAYVSVGRWFEVYAMVEKYKLTTVGAVTLTYHNEKLEQFVNTDCDLEVCVPVMKGLDKPEFKKFGGFLAATAIHVGSHSTIINTHIEIIKWINQHHYKISGPVSEEYIISPIDVKNENEYLSKIVMPIEPLES